MRGTWGRRQDKGYWVLVMGHWRPGSSALSVETAEFCSYDPNLRSPVPGIPSPVSRPPSQVPEVSR
jgi:hypothetical protein